LKAVIAEQLRRRREERDNWQIPVRPDYGLKILSDFSLSDNPGYPYTWQNERTVLVIRVSKRNCSLNRINSVDKV